MMVHCPRPLVCQEAEPSSHCDWRPMTHDCYPVPSQAELADKERQCYHQHLAAVEVALWASSPVDLGLATTVRHQTQSLLQGVANHCSVPQGRLVSDLLGSLAVKLSFVKQESYSTLSLWILMLKCNIPSRARERRTGRSGATDNHKNVSQKECHTRRKRRMGAVQCSACSPHDNCRPETPLILCCMEEGKNYQKKKRYKGVIPQGPDFYSGGKTHWFNVLNEQMSAGFLLSSRKAKWGKFSRKIGH